MKILRYLYYVVFIKFIVLIVLGLNVRHRDRLPITGPAVIVANHNSHLDTMVLISLLSPRMLPHIRPVAAMDYFLRNPALSWFALNIIGILPIARKVKSGIDPFADCSDALNNQDILIFFPEGSRGESEQMVRFKKGISHLMERNQNIPVYPIFMHGLGRALPKGEAMLVPFFCDVFVGEPITWKGDRLSFMTELDKKMKSLSEEGKFPEWEES